MKVFTVSDLHVEYEENYKWILDLSKSDFREDSLIVAGDISENTDLLKGVFEALKNRFQDVFFVPGNHDLWVRNNGYSSSIEKYWNIKDIADEFQVHTEPVSFSDLVIVPLLGWYDYSFGQPSDNLKNIWVDYSACKWENGQNEHNITDFFVDQNNTHIENNFNKTVISFSHFLPRIDLMPSFIPEKMRALYPVLGSSKIEQQVRKLNSRIHIYGHSHVNRQVTLNDILYINNAFGYPSETMITRKELVCVFESEE